MPNTPFYNPQLTYEENYQNGPFGHFASFPKSIPKTKKMYQFLGETVNSPFGIPSGPILNSRFVKAAFAWGFDIVTYKTVRSSFFPSHSWPNILPVKIKSGFRESDLDISVKSKKKYENSKHNLSITNSFGVPSQNASVWQNDFKKALAYAKKGQILIASVMGTKKAGMGINRFVDDYVHTACLAKEAGAKVLEINLSCPNLGGESLICYDKDVTLKIVSATKKQIGNNKLLVKFGYFPRSMTKLLESIIDDIHNYIDGVCAINTIAARVVDDCGHQVLPGEGRIKSGICGFAIKKMGVLMVDKLHKIRAKKNYNYAIVGIGGVMSKEDFYLYKKHKADVIQSATGAMWNSGLAIEIKQSL